MTVLTIQTVNTGKWLKTEPAGPRRNPGPGGFSGESSQTRKEEPTAVSPKFLRRTRRGPPNAACEASAASGSAGVCTGRSRLPTDTKTPNEYQQAERRGPSMRERTSSPVGLSQKRKVNQSVQFIALPERKTDLQDDLGGVYYRREKCFIDTH